MHYKETDRQTERKKTGRQTEINRNSQTRRERQSDTQRERMGDRQSRIVSGQRTDGH
jgi:hypothetical protein